MPHERGSSDDEAQARARAHGNDLLDDEEYPKEANKPRDPREACDSEGERLRVLETSAIVLEFIFASASASARLYT
jgi:hypothetical protein